MKFIYSRKIRFADTDSAGVVYFSQLLSICHEAYEEYLLSLDVDLKDFFRSQTMVIPIIHAEIDFFKPLFCGDTITVHLCFVNLSPKLFEVNYHIEKDQQEVAIALTRHICINPQTRKTQSLPTFLNQKPN